MSRRCGFMAQTRVVKKLIYLGKSRIREMKYNDNSCVNGIYELGKLKNKTERWKTLELRNKIQMFPKNGFENRRESLKYQTDDIETITRHAMERTCLAETRVKGKTFLQGLIERRVQMRNSGLYIISQDVRSKGQVATWYYDTYTIGGNRQAEPSGRMRTK